MYTIATPGNRHGCNHTFDVADLQTYRPKECIRNVWDFIIIAYRKRKGSNSSIQSTKFIDTIASPVNENSPQYYFKTRLRLIHGLAHA